MVQMNKSEQFYIQFLFTVHWNYIPVDFKQGIVFVWAAQTMRKKNIKYQQQQQQKQQLFIEHIYINMEQSFYSSM